MTPVARTALRSMRRTNLGAETQRAIAVLESGGIPELHGRAVTAEGDETPTFDALAAEMYGPLAVAS